jgi:hypothetical protein
MAICLGARKYRSSREYVPLPVEPEKGGDQSASQSHEHRKSIRPGKGAAANDRRKRCFTLKTCNVALGPAVDLIAFVPF